MFDVDFTELLVIFVVALIVLGPTRLPGLVSKVGRWAGKARSMARQFREQLESEVQLEEITRMGQNKPPPASYPAPPPEFGGEPPPPEPPHTGPAMAPAEAVAPEGGAAAVTEAPADPGSFIPAEDPSHRDLADPPGELPKESPHGRSS